MKRIMLGISIVIATLGAPGVASAADDPGPVPGILPLPDVIPVVQPVVDTALGILAGVNPVPLAEEVADVAPDACAAGMARVLPLAESLLDDAASILNTVNPRLNGLLPSSVDGSRRVGAPP